MKSVGWGSVRVDDQDDGPKEPSMFTFQQVDEDADDGILPYINQQTLMGIMDGLPLSVLKGMKTAIW